MVNTVSIVELVNAVVVSVSSCSDEDMGDAEIMFQTVGVTNVQPPSQTGSLKFGGRPLFRFRIGSPVFVNKMGLTSGTSSSLRLGPGERDNLAAGGDRLF
jgi:hypothetical protein